MEQRKLTKADIDKVRHIEGFPIAKDEDIIALSRPPYYTACPNPFIADFIAEHGTPYDEATDDYHREPFAADVSEGKNDPIYNAHSYHTKVPHKAIMRYILHYTQPGDIVFDGFCGTGMAGVAAQACGTPDPAFKALIESEMPEVQWGARRAVLNDLSPAATFIAQNYNAEVDLPRAMSEAGKRLEEVQKEYGWMFQTRHIDASGHPIMGIDGSPLIGMINCTVWSDVYVCPSCSHEFALWDVALDSAKGTVRDSFACPKCAAMLSKRDCDHATTTAYDPAIGETVRTIKKVPVLISYTVMGKRFEKRPDEQDLRIIEETNSIAPPFWVPTNEIPDGEKSSEPKALGFNRVSQLFTNRNLIVLSALRDCLFSPKQGFEYTALLSRSTKHLRLLVSYYFNGGGGWVGTGLSGTMYIPSLSIETNPLVTFKGKISKSVPFTYAKTGNTIVNCASATDLGNIPENSIDYIFTDPPFGANLNYSELSYMWESWLRVITNTETEAIMSDTQKKKLVDYQELMTRAFSQFYRILKPNRWITIEFHNSKNAVWNAIQESLSRAGFIVADVRTINKKQGSFNQVTATGAVKQDLVISAYKPRESFIREFQQKAGDPEMAWEFVRQHLRNVPITADGNHNGKLDVIAERQDYLLFDRMVAWHIMNGIPVPMDAHTFYDGLRQRFLERDGMFFLPDQVNEYDDKRAHMELDTQQLAFVVSDEKNAIAWLNYILSEGPKTYQQIQPLYIQELHQSRQEKMPELLDMLKENFVQDEKGAWYVPDLTNAADLAKVRRKALLKEFWDSCVPGKGKLKVFRMEAIRAGFDECWKQRDFATIVKVGERLPEAVLQEDPALLMYYDNACSRV